MACLTAVIATAGVITAIIFNNQLRVMQGQLDEMREAGTDTKRTADAAKESADAAKRAADITERSLVAAQRAWIKFTRISVGGPLVFDQNGASTSIAFEIANVGRIPASNVTPHAWLGVLKNGGPFPLDEQRRRCDEIRKSPIGGGYTIFPGERFPEKIGVGQYSIGVNLSPDEIAQGLLASADRKHIALFVVGCIDYTFATDSARHHQTGFIFDLRRNIPELISPEGRIDANGLSLFEFGIGPGIQAD
jgi:hypothetical protein